METSQDEMDFREFQSPVIIVTKGLPCTGKSEIANSIAKWARCPVFFIDDFLYTLSLEKGYNATSVPSPEEVDRLYRLAFDALYRAASHRINQHYKFNMCVVIKTRLNSTFEVDRLVDIAKENDAHMVVIVECQMKNEHRFRNRLEYRAIRLSTEEWYKPSCWKDIEKAKDDDCLDDQALELHVQPLLSTRGYRAKIRSTRTTVFSTLVRRLVLDTFDDLNHSTYDDIYLTSPFFDALKYILKSDVSLKNIRFEDEYGFKRRKRTILNEDSDEEDLLEGQYMVLQFDELRRFLVKKELEASASRKRSEYLCTTSRDGNYCVFKYWEKLIIHQNEEGDYHCGVCDERVVLGESAYTCYFCNLTLHKSCAELHDGNPRAFRWYPRLMKYPNPDYIGEKHACKSCNEQGEEFSYECKSCAFQTHLKGRVFPTIIKHDSHEHFLSIEFDSSVCKACGSPHELSSYRCYICRLYYDVLCVSYPKEEEHEHGGYKHALKLVYSREGMEPEEDYWCDICYEDIDPQCWFYSCQTCPYYVAHPRCVMPPSKYIQLTPGLKRLVSNLFAEVHCK